MPPQNNFILKGQNVESIPDCSLGEYIVEKLKSIPENHVIEVDADTGMKQTVGELLARSIRLSEGLKRLDLKENDVVAMLCRNCFEASTTVLGTWLSGAIIAPDDEGMKVAEIKHFIELTKPKYIFCKEEFVSNITDAMNLLSTSVPLILVTKTKSSHHSHMVFEELLVDADVKNYKPQSVKSPSTQLAAIMLSSGTSGLPKGVGITHKNLIFQTINMKWLDILNRKFYFLQISHFHWVTGVLLFLRALTTGLPRLLLRNPTVPNTLKAIQQYKPKSSLMAPLFALSIVNSPDFEKFDVSSMEVILIAGSSLTPNTYEKLKAKWKQVNFLQVYGTTEVSGTISASNGKGDIYSLGKVTPGVQVKVVDTTTGESLKSNTLGEFCIKSPGLMKGYVGNEKATREAIDAEEWLHTGDLGYYDDSGQLYLVDRIKEMVKVMNMQVAPAEVENAIMSVPGVLETAVAGVTNDGNLYELLALVVKDENSTVTAQDIHDGVASKLSDYKRLNGGIYFVESLPKNKNEKLQRKEVRETAQKLYAMSGKKKQEL